MQLFKIYCTFIHILLVRRSFRIAATLSENGALDGKSSAQLRQHSKFWGIVITSHYEINKKIEDSSIYRLSGQKFINFWMGSQTSVPCMFSEGDWHTQAKHTTRLRVLFYMASSWAFSHPLSFKSVRPWCSLRLSPPLTLTPLPRTPSVLQQNTNDLSLTVFGSSASLQLTARYELQRWNTASM